MRGHHILKSTAKRFGKKKKGINNNTSWSLQQSLSLLVISLRLKLNNDILALKKEMKESWLEMEECWYGF